MLSWTCTGSGTMSFALQAQRQVGRWAAFWMMPEPQPAVGCQQSPRQPEYGAYGAWPRSGEIDILEHVNYRRQGFRHYLLCKCCWAACLATRATVISSNGIFRRLEYMPSRVELLWVDLVYEWAFYGSSITGAVGTLVAI